MKDLIVKKMAVWMFNEDREVVNLVKLCLVSTEIAVGDEVYTCMTGDDYWRGSVAKTNYPCKGTVVSQGDLPAVWRVKYNADTIHEHITPMPKTYCIKIFGLVSPEATWLKEGKTINEKKIKRMPLGMVGIGPYHTYQIKGSCGHFH